MWPAVGEILESDRQAVQRAERCAATHGRVRRARRGEGRLGEDKGERIERRLDLLDARQAGTQQRLAG